MKNLKSKKSSPLDDERLPPLPMADKHGRFPALAYARVSLDRDMTRDRRAAGQAEKQLAVLADTRQQAISRIESGTYTVSPKLIERIDRALRHGLKKATNGVPKRK